MRPHFRLITYAVSVHLALGLLAVDHAAATATERIVTMARAARGLQHGDEAFAHDLRVNGLAMRIETAVIEQPPEDVLEDARRTCRHHSRWLLRRMLGDVDLLESRPPRIAHRDNTAGVVACLIPEGLDPDLAASDLIERVLESGGLSIPAGVRITMAEPVARGTLRWTLQSEAPLRPQALFPSHGDAPHPGLKTLRPLSSTVALHADVRDSGHSLVLFRDPSAASDGAFERHTRRLSVAGYAIEAPTIHDDGSTSVFATGPDGSSHLIRLDRTRRNWTVVRWLQGQPRPPSSTRNRRSARPMQSAKDARR